MFFILHFCLTHFLILCSRMPPKRTSKGKEKVASTSGTARTRVPDGGIRRFLTPENRTRYSDIVSHWALLPERPVKLTDFPGFELTTLVQHCGWEKVVDRPHPVYEGLVREFYANFNLDIDTPGAEHLHQTWVRDRWIMFTPEVIQDFYGLTWADITPIPGDFHWETVAEVLLGRANAWPLPDPIWKQIELTPSIGILWLFLCHNVEPTTHRTTFTDPTAGLLYHLVRGHKIDLASFIYDQIHSHGISADRHRSLIFPSLISGICQQAGVTIPSGELPERASPFIKLTTLESQDRARAKHRAAQERARHRQQPAAHDQDADMQEAPPPQAPLEIDT
jgi:hypothetical protein